MQATSIDDGDSNTSCISMQSNKAICSQVHKNSKMRVQKMACKELEKETKHFKWALSKLYKLRKT